MVRYKKKSEMADRFRRQKLEDKTLIDILSPLTDVLACSVLKAMYARRTRVALLRHRIDSTPKLGIYPRISGGPLI